jgi:hypothetical protein
MQARSAREKGAGIEEERLLVGDTGWDFVSVAIEDLTVARGNDDPTDHGQTQQAHQPPIKSERRAPEFEVHPS